MSQEKTQVSGPALDIAYSEFHQPKSSNKEKRPRKFIRAMRKLGSQAMVGVKSVFPGRKNDSWNELQKKHERESKERDSLIKSTYPGYISAFIESNKRGERLTLEQYIESQQATAIDEESSDGEDLSEQPYISESDSDHEPETGITIGSTVMEMPSTKQSHDSPKDKRVNPETTKIHKKTSIGLALAALSVITTGAINGSSSTDYNSEQSQDTRQLSASQTATVGADPVTYERVVTSATSGLNDVEFSSKSQTGEKRDKSAGDQKDKRFTVVKDGESLWTMSEQAIEALTDSQVPNTAINTIKNRFISMNDIKTPDTVFSGTKLKILKKLIKQIAAEIIEQKISR